MIVVAVQLFKVLTSQVIELPPLTGPVPFFDSTHTHTHTQSLILRFDHLPTWKYIFDLFLLSLSYIIMDEDRKPTLRFNYEGFSNGEQNKVEDTASTVKQRKLYNCVCLPFLLC
jgi:hypothetical protein